MSQYKIVSVDESNIHILSNFIENLGKSKITFRYFEKRNISIIQQHLCTYVMVDEDKSIGYGHLEEENEIVWLGIAIVENYTGLGLGKTMMEQLINCANKHHKKEIHLSVDKENKKAISLYKKMGFSLVKELNSDVLLLKYKND